MLRSKLSHEITGAGIVLDSAGVAWGVGRVAWIHTVVFEHYTPSTSLLSWRRHWFWVE